MGRDVLCIVCTTKHTGLLFDSPFFCVCSIDTVTAKLYQKRQKCILHRKRPKVVLFCHSIQGVLFLFFMKI